jgi:hypothetical protein
MGGCGFAVQFLEPSFQGTFNDPAANCGEGTRQRQRRGER